MVFLAPIKQQYVREIPDKMISSKVGLFVIFSSRVSQVQRESWEAGGP